MLELTHVHVLFRNSHFANDFNFNVNEPVRVEVEVYVDFATSLVTEFSRTCDRITIKLNKLMILSPKNNVPNIINQCSAYNN